PIAHPENIREIHTEGKTRMDQVYGDFNRNRSVLAYLIQHLHHYKKRPGWQKRKKEDWMTEMGQR
ncbi:MAG: hypothetical protein ACOC41_07610, partial [Chitinivibrionales bacterium]